MILFGKRSPRRYKQHKGINYYQSLNKAREVQAALMVSGNPGARVVPYDLGWAVQYRKSGPYFPELEGEQ